jgi:hypothetical protein
MLQEDFSELGDVRPCINVSGLSLSFPMRFNRLSARSSLEGSNNLLHRWLRSVNRGLFSFVRYPGCLTPST